MSCTGISEKHEIKTNQFIFYFLNIWKMGGCVQQPIKVIMV